MGRTPKPIKARIMLNSRGKANVDDAANPVTNTVTAAKMYIVSMRGKSGIFRLVSRP